MLFLRTCANYRLQTTCQAAKADMAINSPEIQALNLRVRVRGFRVQGLGFSPLLCLWGFTCHRSVPVGLAFNMAFAGGPFCEIPKPSGGQDLSCAKQVFPESIGVGITSSSIPTSPL